MIFMNDNNLLSRLQPTQETVCFGIFCEVAPWPVTVYRIQCCCGILLQPRQLRSPMGLLQWVVPFHVPVPRDAKSNTATASCSFQKASVQEKKNLHLSMRKYQALFKVLVHHLDTNLTLDVPIILLKAGTYWCASLVWALHISSPIPVLKVSFSAFGIVMPFLSCLITPVNDIWADKPECHDYLLISPKAFLWYCWCVFSLSLVTSSAGVVSNLLYHIY